MGQHVVGLYELTGDLLVSDVVILTSMGIEAAIDAKEAPKGA